MDKEYKVYLLIFPNNKKYCGFTSQNLKRRWDHGHGYIKCPLVYRAIQKYGWDSVLKELIFTSTDEQKALDKEKEIIQTYQLTNPNYGYNLHEGGRPNGGSKFLTEEGRQKISETAKRNWANPEKRAQMIASMTGIKHSKPRTIEHRRKLGLVHKGVVPANARRVEQLNLETKEPIAQYTSASLAATTIDHAGGESNILKVCKGIRPTAYGFKWRYIND